MNISSGQPSALTIFESALILPWVHVYSKGFFPIAFGLHKLYSMFLISATNIYTLQDISSPTSLKISSSWKRIYYIYLYVIMFCFLCKWKTQATHKSGVPDFVSWETPEPNSFSKIWDKGVTDGFLLFPELPSTFWFYQGFCLLEDCVKLLFCVTTSFNMTRTHFSTKRPLVKILQRNLIGKTYNIL